MTLDNFHCHCCGRCCRIPDGIVRVSDAEIVRIAKFLGMTEEEFVSSETELVPKWWATLREEGEDLE